MNFDVIHSLTEDSRALALRALANHANGNLLFISRMRERNYMATGNYDTPEANQDGKRDDDDKTSQAARAEEQGFKRPLTLTQQGHKWACLLLTVIDEAEALGIPHTDFNFPQNMRQYMEGIAVSARSKGPTAAGIRKTASALYVENAEEVARELLIKSYRKDAERITNEVEMAVYAFNDYEGEIKSDVFDMFTALEQHRMYIALANAMLRDAARLSEVIAVQKGKDSNANFIATLETKQEIEFGDAKEMMAQAEEFAKQNKARLDKELNENPALELADISPASQVILRLYTKRKAEQREIEIEAQMRLLREKEAQTKALNTNLHEPTKAVDHNGRHIIDQRAPWRH